MNRSMSYGIVALAIAAGVSLSVFFMRGVARPRALQGGEPGPLSCRLVEGDRLAFEVEADVDTEAMGNGAHFHHSLRATMQWRSLEPVGEGRRVAAVLADLVTEGKDGMGPKEQAALRRPFLFTLAPDCRFQDFAFEPSTPPAVKVQLSGLLRAMEVSVSQDDTSSWWTAMHKDALGEYTATYQRSRSSGRGAPLISKQRAAYRPLIGPRASKAEVEVLGSAMRVEMDAHGKWLRALDDEEHLRVVAGSLVLTDTSERFRLRSTPQRGPFPEIELSAFVAAGDVVAEATPRGPATLPASPSAASLASLLGGLSARLAAGATAAEAADLLAAFLREHPERITGLLDRVRGGKQSDELNRLSFLALARTGTKAAEQALAVSLTDRRLSAMNRMRAANSLPNVPEPSVETAKALGDAIHSGSADRDEESVSTTALRALGTLSRTVDAAYPEVKEEIRGEIATQLGSSREVNDRIAALDAVGNSGDDALAQYVGPFRDDGSSLVRSAAAGAYRHMKPAGAYPILCTWLAREGDFKVRDSIAQSMRQLASSDTQGIPEDVVAAVVEQLSYETHSRVRAQLIQLLGAAAATSPAAHEALVELAHGERDPALMALIGRYLTAEEFD